MQLNNKISDSTETTIFINFQKLISCQIFNSSKDILQKSIHTGNLNPTLILSGILIVQSNVMNLFFSKSLASMLTMGGIYLSKDRIWTGVAQGKNN